jgi:hypothetical protein
MSNNLKERMSAANNSDKNSFYPFELKNGRPTMLLSEKQQQMLSDFKAKKANLEKQGEIVVPKMSQEHGFSR